MDSREKRKCVKDDYDLVAEQYGDEFGNYIEDLDLYEEFEKFLKPGDTILDLGAGTGRTYTYFNKKGYKYIGIDFSEKMKNVAFKLHGDFSYILDDMINIKKHFDKNSIDAIFAVYSLFHLPKEDFIKLLEDMYYVLKDDGVVLLSYQIGDGEKFVDEPYLKEEGKNKLYMSYYRKNEMEELLEKYKYIPLFEKTKRETGDNVIGEDGNDAQYIIIKKKCK